MEVDPRKSNAQGDALIEMKTLCKCGTAINTKVDMTLCGYGKCVRCCLGCMHRTHWNSESIAGREQIERVEKNEATASQR